MLATTIAVGALGARVSSRLGLYVIGVLGAAVAWVVGVLLGVYVLAAIA